MSGVGDAVSAASAFGDALGKGRKRWSRTAALVCNAIRFSAADRDRALDKASHVLAREIRARNYTIAASAIHEHNADARFNLERVVREGADARKREEQRERLYERIGRF